MSARVVQRYVLQALVDPRLTVLVVWEKIGSHDSLEAARKSTMLLPDPRVHFFWSAERVAGKAFQGAVGIQGMPAWDVFLVYGPGNTWSGETPPAPDYFMHNQPSHSELPKDRLLNGYRLAERVKVLLTKTDTKGISMPRTGGSLLPEGISSSAQVNSGKPGPVGLRRDSRAKGLGGPPEASGFRR